MLTEFLHTFLYMDQEFLAQWYDILILLFPIFKPEYLDGDPNNPFDVSL